MEIPAKLGALWNTASLLTPPQSSPPSSPVISATSEPNETSPLQASIFPEGKKTSTFPPLENPFQQPSPAALAGVPIDVWNIRQKARETLLSILRNYPASKYLSLDPSLTKPLGLLVEVAELKQHGVDGWAECGPYPLSTDSPKVIIFLCRTHIGLMKYVVEQIQKLERRMERQGRKFSMQSTNESSSTSPRKYCIVFIPGISEACMQILRQHGIISRYNIDIRSFPMYFVPLDTDLISMELYKTYINFHGNGDPTDLMYVGQALMELQKGNTKPIPQIRAIGSAAHWVSELLMRFRKEHFNTIMAQNMGTAQTSQNMNATDSENQHADHFIPLVRFALSENNSYQSTNRMLQEIKQVFQAPLDYESNDTPSAFSCSVSANLPKAEDSLLCSSISCVFDDIDYLLLIDRRVDLYTPLCSPFTYEALLDTLQGINCTYLDVSVGPLRLKGNATESSSASSINPQKSRLELNSNDSLFQALRNLHQIELGPYLHKKANEIQETYKEKDSLKSISEISEFMKKFKVKQVEHASLSSHVELAFQISKVTKTEEYRNQLRLEDKIVQSCGGGASSDVIANILEMIEKEFPVIEIYRLLCLTSLVNNGIRAKPLNQIKTAIIHQFGFEEFLRLSMLEKVGLLKVYRGKSQWDQVKKQFNLLVDEVEAMKDISYVFSGYSPLSIRLIQMLFNFPDGWRSCPDQLNLLWGPAMEVRQQPFSFGNSEKVVSMTSSEQAKDSHVSQNIQKRKDIVLVFFLGGVTYAEVTAIRKLGEMEQHARKYIIATTSMINSKKLMSGMAQVTPIQLSA